MIVIEARTRDLERALKELADRAGVSYGAVIREEGKYVLDLLLKKTPPKSQQEGRLAVANDMSRLSMPLQYNYFNERKNENGFYGSMAKYIRRREDGKLQTLLSNPNLKAYYGLQLIRDSAELFQKHSELRTKYGRINRKTNYVSYSKDYVAVRNEMQSRVGWTISGWISACIATGARYKKFAERLAPKSGTARYNWGINPFLTARNFNVKIPNYRRFVEQTLYSRVGTTQIKLERVLANQGVNLGFVRVKGAHKVYNFWKPKLKPSVS